MIIDDYSQWVILCITYELALIVFLKTEARSSYNFKVDNEPERDPEMQQQQEDEEEGEWSFEPADYQQLMEQQQLDPIIPNYLDYKDYKEDYYPEA